MDIKKQAAEATKRGDEGIDVHIHNADGSLGYYGEKGDKPVIIRVTGEHSALYKRILRAQRQEKLNPRSLTGGKLLNDQLEKCVACTLSWEGLEIDGVPIPCNPDNVRMVYQTATWIYDDVNEAIHDPTRFFEKGSTTPLSGSDSGHA